MKGKLIVIEGTDCSGKETQSKLLIKKLRSEGIRIENFSYPNYQSPTGKIIGGSYLGKSDLGECLFEEGAPNVDPKVASLYYAADRRYNSHKIKFLLDNGVNVLLDRYVYSNMAHQGGKLKGAEEREDMYRFLETLEFCLLELPKPDIALFLHIPAELSFKLRENRQEKADEHEKDNDHLKNAEKTYLEICDRFNIKKMNCATENNKDIRSIEEISIDVYKYVKGNL
jgi:thymidylate kinase